MFIICKHKYASVFTCNEKVSEYIRKGIHCSAFYHGESWVCCFGRYEDKSQARAIRESLKSLGIACAIKEVER